MTVKTAIKAIEKRGALLVFPINNAKEPSSLWYEFYPRSRMRWEWDDSGDNRVANLWHLREALSRSGRVIYTKWYRGRATFFSPTLYPALIKLFVNPPALSREARALLALLEEESPLSTKQLKKRAKLVGRPFEGSYQRALKELWNQFLIVGFGEVDDGAFPSLAIGASQLMFESLWREAQKLTEKSALECVEDALPDNPSFLLEIKKQLKKRGAAKPLIKQKGIIRGEDLYLIRKSAPS